MPWTRVARVDETIEFIRDYNGSAIGQGLRDDICTMIADRYPRTNNAQKQAYNNMADELSVKGHIRVKADRGNSDERKMRRAIVLLWMAIGAGVPDFRRPAAMASEGMTCGTADLTTKLNAALRLASVVASDAGAGSLFNLEFGGNPLNFIQNNRIMILGTPNGRDLVNNETGTAFTNVLQFHFSYNAMEDRFEFQRQAPAFHGGRHVFDCSSVPAIHWSDVPKRGNDPVPGTANPAGFGSLRGIEVTGANWMMTTQFTGCSFVFSTTGPFYALHLTPALDGKPTLTGFNLADQLIGAVPTVAAARFANFPTGQAANPKVFGPGRGNVNPHGGGNAFYPPKVQNAGGGQMKWMSLFGRFHNGAWELYTQSIDGTLAIMEARRIR